MSCTRSLQPWQDQSLSLLGCFTWLRQGKFASIYMGISPGWGNDFLFQEEYMSCVHVKDWSCGLSLLVVTCLGGGEESNYKFSLRKVNFCCLPDSLVTLRSAKSSLLCVSGIHIFLPPFAQEKSVHQCFYSFLFRLAASAHRNNKGQRTFPSLSTP